MSDVPTTPSEGGVLFVLITMRLTTTVVGLPVSTAEISRTVLAGRVQVSVMDRIKTGWGIVLAAVSGLGGATGIAMLGRWVLARMPHRNKETAEGPSPAAEEDSGRSDGAYERSPVSAKPDVRTGSADILVSTAAGDSGGADERAGPIEPSALDLDQHGS